MHVYIYIGRDICIYRYKYTYVIACVLIQVEVDAINDANIMGKEAGTDKMDGQSESMDMSSWADLGISSTLLRSLCEEGFFIPTPIQALALPCAIHQHLDVVGAAETVRMFHSLFCAV